MQLEYNEVVMYLWQIKTVRSSTDKPEIAKNVASLKNPNKQNQPNRKPSTTTKQTHTQHNANLGQKSD